MRKGLLCAVASWPAASSLPLNSGPLLRQTAITPPIPATVGIPRAGGCNPKPSTTLPRIRRILSTLPPRRQCTGRWRSCPGIPTPSPGFPLRVRLPLLFWPPRRPQPPCGLPPESPFPSRPRAERWFRGLVRGLSRSCLGRPLQRRSPSSCLRLTRTRLHRAAGRRSISTWVPTRIPVVGTVSGSRLIT